MNETSNTETFFALTDGLFSRGFRALADGMLAANDDSINDDELSDRRERRASMGRHPSARRRF